MSTFAQRPRCRLLGHQRHFERAAGTSALPLISDILLSRSKRRSGPRSDIAAHYSITLSVSTNQQGMRDGEAESLGRCNRIFA